MLDPFEAYASTEKESHVTRAGRGNVVPFWKYLCVEEGLGVDDAAGVARMWYDFCVMVNAERRRALEEKRPCDLDQFAPNLESLLPRYPCLKHLFFDMTGNVHDTWCLLNIRADAFSGKSQRGKRITAFGEFGSASANKGGRRQLDEDVFGTHVPPQNMGLVFKISSSELSAKSQRGPWESMANCEGSKLGYSDEWSSTTRYNNASFKALHGGNSLDFDRKFKGKREIATPPPVIYLANELIRFQSLMKPDGGEDRRWQVFSAKRHIVKASDYDPADELAVLKDPTVKANMAKYASEYVWLLLCVSTGCDIVEDDVPFPAPTGSADMVTEMLFGFAGEQVDVRIHALAQDFVKERLERCPAGHAPSTRKDVVVEFGNFATRMQVFGATPAKLKVALENIVENVGDFSAVVSLHRRTVYPYLIKGATEQKGARMYRVKPAPSSSV